MCYDRCVQIEIHIIDLHKSPPQIGHKGFNLLPHVFKINSGLTYRKSSMFEVILSLVLLLGVHDLRLRQQGSILHYFTHFQIVIEKTESIFNKM
jgi:hypothetical protein